jgi:hypothetical protein
MGMLKFEVAHQLSKDEALMRAKKLLEHWGKKYGVSTTWTNDTAKLSGKVMGISLEGHIAKLSGKVMGISLAGHMTITDKAVTGEATDPGMLLRNKARSYLEEKFRVALDPKRKPEELMV